MVRMLRKEAYFPLGGENVAQSGDIPLSVCKVVNSVSYGRNGSNPWVSSGVSQLLSPLFTGIL